MKKYLLILLIGFAQMTSAQQTTNVEDEVKGFQKDRLFTGGSIQLSFGTGQFLGGVNPIFGYSITNWLDGGLVLNYTYASQRDYNAARPGEQPYLGRLRQSVYGGGVFTRVFPLRMIFLQAQAEHNFIDLNFKPHNGGEFKSNDDANSLLVGGGYTTGRDPEARNPYAFISFLVEVAGDDNSPYVQYDQRGNKRPQLLYRAGFNIPLFQGKRNTDRD